MIHQASAHLSARTSPEPLSTVRINRCRDGLMCYFPHDFYIGGALERYGEYSRAEFDFLARFVKEGDVVVEAGANIGCHTVPLARAVGNAGRVLAFEPQRIIYQMLCANLAINGVWNVVAERAGLGAESGVAYVPLVDYTKTGNFGGVPLGTEGTEVATVLPLDQYQLQRCDLIKVDVEGMELGVLKGAAATIRKHRPVLYVENDREEKSKALIEFLQGELGYTPYWHLPPLYSADNFRKNIVNDYGEVVSVNMLCLPSERAASDERVAGLQVVSPSKEEAQGLLQ